MKFSEVIGQELIKERLRNAVNEDRIAHALLFQGPEGCGSLPLAISFAQYILCTERSSNDACGKCSSCKRVEKLVHPDLHFSFPVLHTSDNKSAISDNFITEFRKAVINNPYLSLNQWIEIIASENKQGNIFEAESSKIIEKLSYKPYESNYKIMIIWMAEKMNTYCANKLLKVIEEPPLNTIFLLVVENTTQMLPTILSRCQLIAVPPIENDSLKRVLQNRIHDQTKLEEIVRISRGNYLKAIHIIENQEEDAIWLEYFIKMMRLAFKHDISGIIDWSNEMATLGREKQKRFFMYALKLLRDNFAYNIVGPHITYFSLEEQKFSKNFHPYINMLNVEKIMEEFDKAITQIERNGNAKIIFLDVALQISKVIRIKT